MSTQVKLMFLSPRNTSHLHTMMMYTGMMRIFFSVTLDQECPTARNSRDTSGDRRRQDNTHTYARCYHRQKHTTSVRA